MRTILHFIMIIIASTLGLTKSLAATHMMQKTSLKQLPPFQQQKCAGNKPKPIPLTLFMVLKTVNKHYPQIRIARLQRIQAQGDLIQSMGQFDPFLSSNTRSLPVGGYISNYIDNQIDLPTLYNGLKFFGGYRNGSGDWPIYFQNYLTNSGGEYRAGLSFPLLRDRKIDKQRTEVITRSQRIQMSRQEVAATKLKVYQETIQTYWQWVKTGLQYQAFKQLLSLAEIRQAAIEQQAKQGALPMLAITENRQLIMQRQQLVNQSHMLFQQAAISLSIYYRDEQGNPIIPIHKQLPKLEKVQRIPKLSDQTIAYQEINHHPALMKIDQYAKIVAFKKNLAHNDLQPYLDTVAYTAKQYGTGGYPLLIPQSVFIGLNFKFPLHQREAKGRFISANSELKQVHNQRRFLHDQLKNSLENLFVAKQAFLNQLEFTKKELSFAERVARGETKRFYAGGSSLFLVNQREQAVTQVSLNLIATEVSVHQAISMIKYFSNPDLYRHKKTVACKNLSSQSP